MAKHIPRITAANGNPVIIVAVCKATSPPPISRVAATTPSIIAQNNLDVSGGSGFPPEVIISITMDPESEDVTKKVIMTRIPSADVTLLNGKFSNNTKRATGIFSCTAVAKPPAPNISILSAVFPKMVNQRKVMNVGTIRTPAIN